MDDGELEHNGVPPTPPEFEQFSSKQIISDPTTDNGRRFIELVDTENPTKTHTIEITEGGDGALHVAEVPVDPKADTVPHNGETLHFDTRIVSEDPTIQRNIDQRNLNSLQPAGLLLALTEAAEQVKRGDMSDVAFLEFSKTINKRLRELG